ncbi:MAG TPA: hypothetical protein VMY42_05185 [Thermoguttaceae bacterium]|nr:hypothetical protein [Thermoguttaceae bacterium]
MVRSQAGYHVRHVHGLAELDQSRRETSFCPGYALVQRARPFYGQKKNHNVFGHDCDIYFTRFFHNAPGGPLVNHFYTKGPVFAAPLKAVEVDHEGILRLKWWKNNDKLKAKRIETELAAVEDGYAASIRMFDVKLPRDKVHVIEGMLGPTKAEQAGGMKRGIFFDHGDGHGEFLAFGPDSTSFGDMNADGSNSRVHQTCNREIDFGPTRTFRLVIKHNMMELYINDYLMNLKRVKWNGHIGLIGADNNALQNIDVWQSD